MTSFHNTKYLHPLHAMKKKIFGFPLKVGFRHTMSMILSTEKSVTLQRKSVELN